MSVHPDGGALPVYGPGCSVLAYCEFLAENPYFAGEKVHSGE